MVHIKLPSQVLRQTSPRKLLAQNRFAALREQSPAPGFSQRSGRDRSASVKRKNEDSQPNPATQTVTQRSYASVATPNTLMSTLTSDEIDIMNANIGTIRSLCDNVVSTLGDIVDETPLVRAVLDIRTAITHLSRNQEILIDAAHRQTADHAPLLGPPKTPKQSSGRSKKSESSGATNAATETAVTPNPTTPEPTYVDLGALAKKPKPNANKPKEGGSTPDNWEDLYFTYTGPLTWKPATGPRPGASLDAIQQSSDATKRQEKALDERTKKLKRFKDAVEKAERSTLIMNLDLGKTPTINQETISTKIALSLSAAAAAKEGKKTSMPSEATLGRLDDVLSVPKSMSLFGRATKSYRNPRDAKSGSYCTIPVKYEYKDRATRLAAERVLRDTCGVHCATPYPTALRECIKRTIHDVKEASGDVYVKVTVDTKAFCLRVQRQAKKNGAWLKCNFTVPLPESVLDVDSRKLPKDFSFEVPCTPGKRSRFSRRDFYTNSQAFISPQRESASQIEQPPSETGGASETMDTDSAPSTDPGTRPDSPRIVNNDEREDTETQTEAENENGNINNVAS